jgi:hypothetical protein
VDALDDPNVVREGAVVGFEAPVVAIENPVIDLTRRREYWLPGQGSNPRHPD